MLTADTVLQEGTRLLWQRCAVGQVFEGNDCFGRGTAMNAADASRACTDGLRLPTPEEYFALLDPCSEGPDAKPWFARHCRPCRNSELCLSMFGNDQESYWPSSAATEGKPVSWYVDFAYGFVDYEKRGARLLVRCLRDVP